MSVAHLIFTSGYFYFALEKNLYLILDNDLFYLINKLFFTAVPVNL